MTARSTPSTEPGQHSRSSAAGHPPAPAKTPAPPAQPAPTKPRIALWDNARFILIVLVVVGHTISTVRTDSALGFALYAYIYLFHMPAMILLSGMFARAECTPKIARSTLQLLATWLVWEGIWALIHLVFEGQAPGSRFLVSPAWTLWFLVTLVTMRILLPYIARLRYPLLVSIGLALVGGLSPAIGSEFSASRTLSFLPFFVLGWLARERGWLDGKWFTKPSAAMRSAAWATLGAIALALALTPQLRKFWRIDRWLTWRDDYAILFERAPLGALQPESWWAVAVAGMLVAAALLGIAALMIFALLLVLPRSHQFYTVWGTRTLFVYLLHGPIVYWLRTSGAIDEIASWGGWGLPLLIALGIALTALLSMRWITTVFRSIVEPKIDWLLSRA